MAPSASIEKLVVNNYTYTTGSVLSPVPVDSSGTIINVIFGLLALIIGVITVWQAQRAYHIWSFHHVVQASNKSEPSQKVFLYLLYQILTDRCSQYL